MKSEKNHHSHFTAQ